MQTDVFRHLFKRQARIHQVEIVDPWFQTDEWRMRCPQGKKSVFLIRIHDDLVFPIAQCKDMALGFFDDVGRIFLKQFITQARKG